MIREARVDGVSTRAMDALVQAKGGSGVSRSRAGRPCEEIDGRVDAFPIRPVEGERPHLRIDVAGPTARRGGASSASPSRLRQA